LVASTSIVDNLVVTVTFYKQSLWWCSITQWLVQQRPTGVAGPAWTAVDPMLRKQEYCTAKRSCPPPV